jgi:hypothetical protein
LTIVGVGGFFLALTLFAQPASAMTCSATANGSDVKAHQSPRTPLKVRHDQNVHLAVVADTSTGANQQQTAYEVKLEFAGQQWTVASGAENSNRWSNDVKVAKYATYGVGLYKVVAISQDSFGNNCFARVYVRVTGKSPLSTTAGEVAAGAAGVGVAGALVAGTRSGGGFTDDQIGSAVTDFVEGEGANDGATSVADEQAATVKQFNAEHGDDSIAELDMIAFCGSTALLGIGLTVRAMASDAGHHALAAIGRLHR